MSWGCLSCLSQRPACTQLLWLIDESDRGYLVSPDARAPQHVCMLARDAVAGIAYERPRRRAGALGRWLQHMTPRTPRPRQAAP